MTADQLRMYSTRKAYLHIYAVPVTIVIALEMLHTYGSITFNSNIFLFAAAITAICILYSELDRSTYWIDVDKDKVTVEKGLLRRKKLILPKHILTDLHVDQSVFQRLLNFGRLTISSFSEDHKNIHIHINDPHHKLNKIQEIVKRDEEENVRTSS